VGEDVQDVQGLRLALLRAETGACRGGGRRGSRLGGRANTRCRGGHAGVYDQFEPDGRARRGARRTRDFLRDESAPEISEAVVHNVELALLNEAIKGHSERTQHVLVRRHGLAEGTRRELAEEVNISKGRVRLLQRKAEKMLRIAKHGRFLGGGAA
jgi:hypothetical protein